MNRTRLALRPILFFVLLTVSGTALAETEYEKALERRAQHADAADDSLDPHTPSRQGFTLELGGGVGYWAPLGQSGISPTTSRFALGGTLSLGGFLSPKFALMFHASSASLMRTVTTYSNLVAPNFASFGVYSLGAQYFLNDRVFIGGGPGVGLVMTSDPTGLNYLVRAGPALNARVGFNIAQVTHHSFVASFELNAGLFRASQALSGLVLLSWQYH